MNLSRLIYRFNPPLLIRLNEYKSDSSSFMQIWAQKSDHQCMGLETMIRNKKRSKKKKEKEKDYG